MGVTFPGMQQSVYPHNREWTMDFGYDAPEFLDRVKGSSLASLPLFRASLSRGSNQQRARLRLTTRCLTVVAKATKTLPLLLPGTRLPARWPVPASLAVWWCACLANNSEQKEECPGPWAVAVPPPSTLPTTASQSPSHHSHLALTSSRKG